MWLYLWLWPSAWSGGDSSHGRLELEQLVGLGVTFSCRDLEIRLDELVVILRSSCPRRESEYLQYLGTKKLAPKTCVVLVCLSMYVKTKSSTKREENSVSRLPRVFHRFVLASGPRSPSRLQLVTLSSVVGCQLSPWMKSVSWNEVGMDFNV